MCEFPMSAVGAWPCALPDARLHGHVQTEPVMGLRMSSTTKPHLHPFLYVVVEWVVPWLPVDGFKHQATLVEAHILPCTISHVTSTCAC